MLTRESILLKHWSKLTELLTRQDLTRELILFKKCSKNNIMLFTNEK
jgi:hypothetical protein